MIAAVLVLGAGDVVARLRPEPAAAAIGESVRWILEVEHPEGAIVRLPGKLPPDGGPAWVAPEEARVVRDPASLRASWTAFALEPGDQAPPKLAVQVALPDGSTSEIEAETVALTVLPALAEGEDAPRPMKGFRPGIADDAGFVPWPFAAAAAALALAGLLAWRLRRRAPAPAAAPGAIGILLDLERLATEDPGSAREIVRRVVRLLRERVDAFLGEGRAALTDEAYAARLEGNERVPPGARVSIARLLRGAEPVKYAQVVPTRFALAEVLADARAAVEAIEAAPPPGPGASGKRLDEAA